MQPLTDAEKQEILTRVRRHVRRVSGWWEVNDPSCGQHDYGYWGHFSTEEKAWAASWKDFVDEDEVYRHKKGGVYRKLMEGDMAQPEPRPVVIYEHLWPHERAVWIRDKAEFEEPGRFERITS